MTTKVLIFALSAVGMLAADGPAEKPNMRAQLAGEVRKDAARLSAAPRPEHPPAAPAAASDDIVVLEPYRVTNPVDAFAPKIDEEERKVQADKFTFVNGGTLWQKDGIVIRLKYVPEHKGWDIFSLSW